MDPRSEIKRLLASAGEPPPAPADLERVVWSRISPARSQPPAAPIFTPDRWSWLPRRWEIAVTLAAAAAIGAATAEIRLDRDSPATPQQRYLAAIDPTAARSGEE